MSYTYSITLWSRVLLEKLTGFQVVKKFPSFLEPEKHYRSHMCQPLVHILSQRDNIHASTFHFVKIHLNIILQIRLGPASGPFPSGLPTKTLYTSLLFPYALLDIPI